MRSRQWSDGEREIWNEMQRDAAPDVRELWSRQHTSRRERVCSCGRVRPVGQRYTDAGLMIDGKFERHTLCVGACPGVHPPDVYDDEAAEQFAIEERRLLENAEMDRHFRDHPHG